MTHPKACTSSCRESVIEIMMKKTNRRSFQSPHSVIPKISRQQRDAPNTMHNAFGIDGIGSTILQVILEVSNSADILSNLAAKIGGLFTVDACIIVSTKADGENLNDVNYWQQDSSSFSVEDKIIDQLSHLSLSEDDRPRLIDRTQPHLFDSLEQLFAQFPAPTIWLGVTTGYQQQINGLILLVNSNSSPWTNSEQELLIQTSNSMAIAISQIQLQQKAEIKTKYQSLLKNISREINYSSHPNRLFDSCLAKICTTLGLDRGMVLMLKYQNPLEAKNRRKKSVKGTVEIASIWTSSQNCHSPDELFFSFGESALCQQAWQNAPQYLCFSAERPFLDLSTDKLPDSMQNIGSALLMMPLMGKKSHQDSPAVVLGFLVLQHNSTYHWSEDKLDLVDWVGVQISTAVINHQTLNQVQSIVEERTAQLKWSLDVQAKLSEKMRQHIEQLQRLNQLKDDFMNSMSHELKTPLTSMKMAIKMLRQTQISPEMRERYLNILEQEWNREYSLIKDLLTLQELESGEITYSPQELDLNQTIDGLTQSFNSKWHADKGINLETTLEDPDLKIYTDAESLTHILSELLLNAGKYSDADTTIELSAKSQTTQKGKNITIAIANQGAGITPEELPHIFDKFRRGKGVTDRAVPGTGLGLALVQHLVEHLNGKIDVTSEPLEGDDGIFVTTFVLKLPQFQPAIS